MKRYFLDTEFSENGKTIDLISIALVGADGREYYAHSEGYKPELCNEWVKDNVLPHLKDVPRKPRYIIAAEIRRFIGFAERPEFWAYFADYDWVVLCQLYGTMRELPHTWPKYCLDLKQEMHRKGVTSEALPPQPANAHDALADARWLRDAWEYVRRHHIQGRFW